MNDFDPSQNLETTPEQASRNRRQVWLTLLVMLGSSCVGIVILTVAIWFVFNKILPPGWFQ